MFKMIAKYENVLYHMELFDYPDKFRGTARLYDISTGEFVKKVKFTSIIIK